MYRLFPVYLRVIVGVSSNFANTFKCTWQILLIKNKGLGSKTVGVISLCNSEWLFYRQFPVYLKGISSNLANTFLSSRQILIIKTVDLGANTIGVISLCNYTPPRKLCLWEGILFSRCPSVRTSAETDVYLCVLNHGHLTLISMRFIP